MYPIHYIVGAPPIRWLGALIWTLWISIILIQPEAQPIIDIGIQPAPPTFERELVFTAAHVFAFGLTVLLWWWALTLHIIPIRALVTAIIIALIVGTLTEALQTFAPDRYPSLADFIANLTGAGLMALWLHRHGHTLGH